ncbi:hypothetical protein Anas_00880 [Armadillidium nasatum]|uniref:Uncharacterized protein n=1 Tax=Armadillidium nasatum TaxID=96803 RepID=A0A5N5TK97_9CRUS|nr:hypothetical protein Anas_00880 [Armadillidium nasatum]
MYWEQLENRRRFLYRRTPLPSNNNCNCCDEYGFVSPSELYPWRMWDSIDERYWPGGAQLYSPAGEDSSTASRSVLLGSNNLNGAPSLWLPWGGAWGAQHTQGQQRDATTPADSTGTPGDLDNGQNDDNRPQTTGVLLRPFLPRGLEARFGLRRQPPPPPGHSRRPLSDPGVALQLPRYPPPFSEAFLPPLPYEGLEAFSRLMWDPPPPYSQPASQENLSALPSSPHSPSSPQDTHHAFQVISTPSRRPHTLSDLIRGAPPVSSTGISSPSNATDPSCSPAHFPHLKDGACVLGSTGSLPLNHRMRRLPLGHVKSLGDVTEAARESLEAIFCDGKELSSLEKLSSHSDVAQRLLALKARHLKGGSDPRNVYGKGEQESELYFADVSSCVSLRQDDKDDTLYYSEPQKEDKESIELEANHVYERVRCYDEGDEEEEEEDVGSHHTSDDTMIVHTSSSENTYSVTSPLTDHSSTSPMATDTDAYSSYQAPSPKCASQNEEVGNLNNIQSRRRQQTQQQQQPKRLPSQSRYQPPQVSGHSPRYNDNELGDEDREEPRYESIPGGDQKQMPTASNNPVFVAPSDLNGNVALSTGHHEGPVVVRQAQRTNLSLPLRRVIPSTTEEAVGTHSLSPENDASPAPQGRRNRSSQDRTGSHNSEPNTPTDRRLQSVQGHFFTLKSVNV